MSDEVITDETTVTENAAPQDMADTTQVLPELTALELLQKFCRENKVVIRQADLNYKTISDGSVIIEKPQLLVEFVK